MNKPNVILMFVDDLGIGDISAFNPEGKIHTSHVDRLARDGMMFTDSHSCSALCTPSRYSLLTGRYPWRSRLKFLVLPGDSDPLIEKDRMTMAHMFKNAGYRTACVGKWHLGLEWAVNEHPAPEDFGESPEYYENLKVRGGQRLPSTHLGRVNPVQGLDIDYSKPITYGPNQYGFDYFYGLPASLDQPPFVYIENDRVLEMPTAVSGHIKLDRDGASMQSQWERGPIAPSYDHEQVLDDMNDKVLELIDHYSDGDEPFFIYYPTPAVHGPLLPNKKFKGSSGLNLYADVVLQVDDMVRQITEKLKAKGIYEDTIFIFTSDNGCSGVADYPFLLSKGHNPSAIYRGKKGAIYEGGHRVPTIVSWPAAIPAGTVCDSLVCHSDFFRSFSDILGISLPDNAAEDSISNLPLWKDPKASVREDAVFACSSGYMAIEKDGWKLELCENGGDTPKAMGSAFQGRPVDQKFELYNLRSDVRETTDVYEQQPEIVEQLKQQLTKRLDDGRTTDGAPQENFVPEDELWVQINWKM